jgi:hypothetical protein
MGFGCLEMNVETKGIEAADEEMKGTFAMKVREGSTEVQITFESLEASGEKARSGERLNGLGYRRSFFDGEVRFEERFEESHA